MRSFSSFGGNNQKMRGCFWRGARATYMPASVDRINLKQENAQVLH